MYIYNVTVNVDLSIHDRWLLWIKEHIPEVLATGRFTEAKLTKVLVDEKEGVTYSVQYMAKTREDLDAYYQNDAARLQKEGLKLFADKCLAFRTELEILDQYTVSYN